MHEHKHTGVEHTYTLSHQHKSPEAHSLIELSHQSTDCFFFLSYTSLYSRLFLNQQRVGGGKKSKTEVQKKESEKGKWGRAKITERKEAEVKIQWGKRKRWMEEWRCYMGNLILWRKHLDREGNELLQRQLYQKINWKSGKCILHSYWVNTHSCGEI